MRKSVRLVNLMAGTALVAFLGSSCAENPLFASGSDSVSPIVVDRALNAARVARANGDLNEAASKLAYLVSVAPDNADVLSEYGKVLTEMGQPDEALAYFDKAKARNSDDWKLYNAEGVAYDEKHDFESARADYARALKLNPGSSAVLNNAARSRMMAGDLVGAEALLAQAHPTAQENGFFTSTQAQLTELELKSNSNAPVAALTPKMDVQAPPMPPAPAPTVPVETHEAPPVASAAPRTIVASTPSPKAQAAPMTAAQVPAAPAAAVVAHPNSLTPPPVPAEAMATAVAQTPVAQAPAVAPAAAPAPAIEKPTEAQTAQQTPAPTAAVSVPSSTPVVEKTVTSPAVSSPTPEVDNTAATQATAQAATAMQPLQSNPAPIAQTASQSVPVVEHVKAEAPTPAAASVAATAVSTPMSAAAPASPEPAPTIVAQARVSPAAVREAALEAGVAPPQVTAPQTPTAAPQPSAMPSAPSAVKTEALYIRIGMFRSRAHARHVATRLRQHRMAAHMDPRDVHVVRLTRSGRHWYRVWIRGGGDRPEVQDELATVHALGYLHARIIVKLETERHLANSAPTIVASSGH